ncbi:MAG: site-2 protease family protein [Thermoplasmata archaeon]
MPPGTPVASLTLNGYAIAGLLVVAYGAIVYGLWRAGWIGKDRTLSLFGPALMIKTRRGRSFIERVGRRVRAWSIAGDVAIVLGAASMVAMVALLVLDAAVSVTVRTGAAPSVQEALGIPGINPIIPIGYGIAALVVGVALHELFHGFVARSQRIGVQSLGILWCVIPIGAFVEQDDADMEQADRRRRDRVAAAGILANFAIALVCFLLLSGLVASSVAPNATGVGVLQTVAGAPAASAGIAGGDIITAFNGTPTPTNAAFAAAIAQTHPNQTVSVAYFSAVAGRTVETTVRLGANPTNRTIGYLGVYYSSLSPSQIRTALLDPLALSGNPITGAITWLLLPIAGLEPLQGGPASFYHMVGPLGAVGPGAGWILLNLLYWFAWMNFLLGASNALPLVPLDGGLLVRDYASALAARLRRGWDAVRIDRFGSSFAVASSLAVLLLLLWQFVVPRL